MSHYVSFDPAKIDAALAAARQHAGEVPERRLTASELDSFDPNLGGEYSVSAGCVSVKVEDGKICVDLPLVGKYCLPVPSWIPSGAELKACVSLCTTWGLPTGVKLTVSFNDNVIFTKSFLKC